MDNDVPSFEDTQPVTDDTNRAPASAPPAFEDTQPAPVAKNQAAAPPPFEETQPVENYETTGQQLLTAGEGLGKGLLGPVFTYGETKLFNNAQEQEARAAVNPATHFGSEAVGLVGPALATLGASGAARLGIAGAAEAIPAIQAASKFTQAGVLENLARAGSSALGLGGEGAGVISKIGSAAVKGMIENAGFQSGDEVSKQILNPNMSQQAVSSALYNVGAAALFGGAVGSIFETLPALWTTNYERQTGGILKAIVNKTGGLDNVVPDHVNDIINYLGIDAPPEIRASMSADPEIKQLASVLNQSDTTRSGLEYQQTIDRFRSKLDEEMVSALGKDPAAVTKDFSEAQAGNKIGTTLAGEYDAKMSPVSESFENARTKYSDAELGPTLEEKGQQAAELQKQLNSSVIDPAQYKSISDQIEASKGIPGVKDILAQDISRMIHQEGWMGSDDIMKEANRLLKRIPELDTIGDLQKEMTTVGNNTASKLPFGMQDPLSRAGGMMKSAMRDAEFASVGKQIGSEEGIDALNQFNQNRQNFSALAKQKDALDDRLKIGGSATNYAKGIQAMATTDGEQVLKRLSGRGDADILKVLQEHFPQTAQAVRGAHVDRIVADAAKAAKGDSLINGNRLLNNISKMSPEVRNFAIPQSSQAGMSLSSALSDRLQDLTHNYSNTARTVDKLVQHLPGAAAGIATMLLSHSPEAALVVGAMTKPLIKDAPDAIRLALLKFLGSNKPINPSAFKTAMEFIASTIKGNNIALNATKNVFKGAGEVFSSAITPEAVKESRDLLDEKVKQIQEIPGHLMKTGQKTSYYMPEHGQAMAQTAAGVSGYLNQIRPRAQQNAILDSNREPSSVDMSGYNKALTIAQQPLSVLPKIKNGTILPEEVNHLKTMYPGAYQDLTQKLMTAMADHLSDGGTILYRTKQGLSIFSGQPLDSTMTPQAIQSIQSLYSPKAPAPQAGPKKQHKNTSKLGEISKDHYTQSQAAAQRATAWD